MSIKVVLFDLDGTLLPMDQDVFVHKYFSTIAMNLAKYGYEPKKLIDTIMLGTVAMVKNDGEKPNEEAFWNKFCEVYGENARDDEPKFEKFYIDDFIKVKDSCGFNVSSKGVIKKAKEKGLRLALATNPIFPAIATKSRVAWAGLDVDDFEFITTYENSSFCKPNLNYYKEILQKLNVSADECLMVGNDVGEDMVAKELGMEVFLLTDCLINKKNEDISYYPNGGFEELFKYLESI